MTTATAPAGSPQGPQTEWVAQSKSIIFLEYGFPSVDKATNQPNVFFDAEIDRERDALLVDLGPGAGLTAICRGATTRSPPLALEAIYEYWNTDGHNATSGAGLPMLQFAFSCVWNWDARPFPLFPIDNAHGAMRATGRPATGRTASGRRCRRRRRPRRRRRRTYPTFPALATLGWSVHRQAEVLDG